MLFWNRIKSLIINKFCTSLNLAHLTNKILIFHILILISTIFFIVFIFIFSVSFFFILTCFLSYFLRKDASDIQITRIRLKKWKIFMFCWFFCVINVKCLNFKLVLILLSIHLFQNNKSLSCYFSWFLLIILICR